MSRVWRELVYFIFCRPVRGTWVRRSIDKSRPTVVLVSGFTSPRRAASVLRRRLMRDGFNVRVFSLDVTGRGRGFHGLAHMSEKLLQILREVHRDMECDKSRVSIVAHSAGGLVARYCVQRLGGYRYCRILVTLATPHQGIWVAALGILSPLVLKIRCLFQLLPISRFIKRINCVPLPKNFPLISVHSTDDALCPPSSTRLPESWKSCPSVQVLEVSRLAHSDFLLQKRSYRLLLNCLSTPSKPQESHPKQTVSAG